MNDSRQIEEKVYSYIREHHMINPGDCVLAGISGGADSVCLLLVLLKLREKMSFSLGVVHVNHGIRREAAEDARYVEELCKSCQLPYFLVEKNVVKEARLRGCSEEEAGRLVRYEAFERIGREFGADRIAVAHNGNDRAETMLFHLFRGSGLKGLSGIPPCRDGIIRPLLCLERRQIEAYLEERGVSYCRDATNESDSYTRNRIRHHILPYAEKDIVSGCVGHMNRTAELLAETEDYLRQQEEEALADCVSVQEESEESPDRISITLLPGRFLQYHPILQKRMLHRILKELSPGRKDISYLHTEALLTLFTETGNRRVDLPFHICGRREYDRVFIERIVEAKAAGTEPAAETGTEQGEAGIEGFHADMIVRARRPEENFSQVPQNECTKCFDYDKMKESPVLRTRKTGDYFTIRDRDGRLRHQSLKDYLINNKIPERERDHIPVLAEGSHILWLVGYRISEYYKVSEETTTVLQVSVRETT